jgi:hypothetical protein
MVTRKKYYIFKQLVKKIREITEVEHKITKLIGMIIQRVWF